MTTTTIGSTLDTQGTAREPAPGAAFITTTVQSARRTFLQYLRTPQLLVLPTIIGAMFLFIFRYVFGGAIDAGNGVDYVDFLVPGFLLTTILWTGMNAPAGVAEDAASGVHDRFRSLPIPRTAVVAGRSLADGALVSWTLLVNAVLGFAVGFRTHGGIAAAVGAFVVMLVVTYVFSWVFLTLGLVGGNAQAAQGMSTLLVVPFTFLSSAYVPVDSMPGWLQPIAEHQPITVMINAVRSLMLGSTEAAGVGHTTGYWVVLSLVWCAGILAVFSTLAVHRFARTR
ncbi:MAG TPA: ABC transporter permease [Acidimicrobiales bacterium]|nr:ABC transporter permease [Acidimicrobiales bacterium]